MTIIIKENPSLDSQIYKLKSKKQNLTEAKKNKNDEYYTQKNDIQKELKNYKHLFADKTVFCNCDDPEWSQFYIFFKSKMQEYKIKKLISTHYTENDLYDKSYQLECVVLEEKNGEIKETRGFLQGNGDFTSKECIELLKQADIVCTNPPFSLSFSIELKSIFFQLLFLYNSILLIFFFIVLVNGFNLFKNMYEIILFIF